MLNTFYLSSLITLLRKQVFILFNVERLRSASIDVTGVTTNDLSNLITSLNKLFILFYVTKQFIVLIITFITIINNLSSSVLKHSFIKKR